MLTETELLSMFGPYTGREFEDAHNSVLDPTLPGPHYTGFELHPYTRATKAVVTPAPRKPPEFIGWPKTPRLNRTMIVSEKIDGTNGCLVIEDDGEVYAQSRNRMLERPSATKPGTDNAGFRAWAEHNAEALYTTLGAGRHFGEWWGGNIQRGYGLVEKRFSLFNTNKWGDIAEAGVPGLHVVPVLLQSEFDTTKVNTVVELLRRFGSQAAPGYMKPEGVCVFLSAANSVFKVLLENDEKAKTA